MTNTDKLNKTIKIDEIKIKQLKQRKRAILNELQAVKDQLRATKAQRRYHKSQLSTASRLDILDQALKDLQ